MSKSDIPSFDSFDEEQEPLARLGGVAVTTESIDLDSLFKQDLTTSGSFDVSRIKQSSFGQLLMALPMPALLIGKSFGVRFCNEAWGKLTVDYKALVGRRFTDLCATAQETSVITAFLAEIFETRKPRVKEQRLLVLGRLVWARVYFRPIRLAGERMVLGLVEDLTAEKVKLALMTKIERAKTEWEMTFDLAPNLIAVIDREYRILRLNKAMAAAGGVTPERGVGQPCYRLIHRAEAPPLFCPNDRVLADGQQHSIEYHDSRLGRYFMETLSPVCTNTRTVTGCVLVSTDVSERKKLENDLAFQATHDPLTNMLNRRHALELLSAAFETASRYSHPLSVGICDIDSLKDINDTLGHRAGDKVLIEFSAIAKASFRQADILGRYGGDEFIIAFPDTAVPGAVDCLERLRAKLQNSVIDAEGKGVKVTCSFGVAGVFPGVTTVDDVIAQADRALYRAKNEGRNRVVVFDARNKI